MNSTPPWILAVDGGGSKTDALAIDAGGTILARARGRTSSPQLLGTERAVAVIDALADELVGDVDRSAFLGAALYLSGLDYQEEVRRFRAAAAHHWWLPSDAVVDNDLFALLRAGTSSPDAAAVVVGTGINAIAVRADGASARFPALGSISGDWGGGSTLGSAALWHAFRSEDGRGDTTTLEGRVRSHFGRRTVAEVASDIHFGRLEAARLSELSVVLFEAARAGDRVAGDLVDRQADEVVTMAAVLLDRLGLTDRALPVILGGGVLASGDARLLSRIRSGMHRWLPHAIVQVVPARPILGAALLALEHYTVAPSTALAALQQALGGEETEMVAAR